MGRWAALPTWGQAVRFFMFGGGRQIRMREEAIQEANLHFDEEARVQRTKY